MTNEDYLKEFFGEPISTYTDADALSDGTLFDISSLNLIFESKPVNRMTATVFWGAQPRYPLGTEQTVELCESCDEEEEPINFDMQAFARDLTEQLKQATGSDRLRTIPPDMWRVENDVNGWTLMIQKPKQWLSTELWMRREAPFLVLYRNLTFQFLNLFF